MSYSDVVYDVVFVDLEQLADLVQPYSRPVSYKPSPLLIHEDWSTPIINLMPRRCGNSSCSACNAKNQISFKLL